MPRDIVSVWLPRLATDLFLRREPERRHQPFAAVLAGRHGLSIAGVNRAAENLGVLPSMSLADARAIVPALAAADADAQAETTLLERLGLWANRFTPLAATDSPDGLMLDVTGCLHLFGGAARLLSRLGRALSAGGLDARLAFAPNPAAAWALARFGPNGTMVAAPPLEPVLDPLPVAALRLEPKVVKALSRVGLRRIGDLRAVPRTGVARRYGQAVITRLDQALGLRDEPISPLGALPRHAARIAFPEPVSDAATIAAALDRLLTDVCAGLEKAAMGARQLDLLVYRIDAAWDEPPQRISVGTARPVRAVKHLRRLYQDRLERIAPGLGIEVMVLAAPAADPLPPEQTGFEGGDRAAAMAVDELVDRLANRFGRHAVARPQLKESWVPERAVVWPATGAKTHEDRRCSPWPFDRARPLRLLPRPEPVEAIAPIPDDPPVMVRWRGVVHRISRAEGPERIEPEWWHDPGGQPRDYYRLEDTEGRRYWVYRAGRFGAEAPVEWYLHGFFG